MLTTLPLKLARRLPLPLKLALWQGIKSLLLLQAALFGKNRCPVCRGRVARFVPLAPDARVNNFRYATGEAETCNAKNYLCPRCEATDRERLYALYMTDHFRSLNSNETVRIVDFAPSPALSRFIKNLTDALPQSFSYRTADLAMDGVDDRVDITNMKSYEDSSFDFLICSHVLEHVTDDKAALAELYRILKPGRRGILMVPIVLNAEEIDEDPSVTDPAERWRRFGQDDHVRLYSKEGFLARIRQAGFTVLQLGHEHFGKETFNRHGITERSVLYVVEKNGW